MTLRFAQQSERLSRLAVPRLEVRRCTYSEERSMGDTYLQVIEAFATY